MAPPPATTDRKESIMKRLALTAALTVLAVPVDAPAAVVPTAVLEVQATKLTGKPYWFAGCTYDFDLSQKWGDAGNITRIQVDVLTSGSTLVSASSPDGVITIASSTSMELDLFGDLWSGPKSMTAKITGTSSFVTLKFTGMDDFGNVGEFTTDTLVVSGCAGTINQAPVLRAIGGLPTFTSSASAGAVSFMPPVPPTPGTSEAAPAPERVLVVRAGLDVAGAVRWTAPVLLAVDPSGAFRLTSLDALLEALPEGGGVVLEVAVLGEGPGGVAPIDVDRSRLVAPGLPD